MFVTTFGQAVWVGDGWEYLLYARVLATHLSPEIRVEDVERVATIMPHGDPELERDVHSLGTGRPLGSAAEVDARGLVRAADGRLYTWHFWLYPAFVAPFLRLTEWLGAPPLVAFVLCNWALVLVALGYLAVAWRAPVWQKHVLAALFLLTGTTYYIWWPHPEVFTASLVLLALMAATDRRHGWAMLSTALAATQAPPLLFLLVALAVKTVVDRGLLRVGGGSKTNRLAGHGRVILLIVGAFAVAFAPMAFFQSTLGVANPIVAAGAADSTLVSWARLASLFCDLNQGMVVAIPGVALGVAVLALVGVARLRGGRSSAGLLMLRPIALGALIALAMAVPALAAVNWNSGQSVFSRYAYWLSIPITFGLVASLAALSWRWRIALGATVVIVQVMTVGYYGFWGNNWRSDHLHFKPAARYVLLRLPSFYDPVPEIFIERLRQREGMPDISAGEGPVLRFPETGEPTKVLVREDQTADVASKLRRACRTLSAAPVEGGWVYLNVHDDARCLKAGPMPGGEGR